MPARRTKRVSRCPRAVTASIGQTRRTRAAMPGRCTFGREWRRNVKNARGTGRDCTLSRLLARSGEDATVGPPGGATSSAAGDPHEVAHIPEALEPVDRAHDRGDLAPRQQALGTGVELLLDREL